MKSSVSRSLLCGVLFFCASVVDDVILFHGNSVSRTCFLRHTQFQRSAPVSTSSGSNAEDDPGADCVEGEKLDGGPKFGGEGGAELRLA